MTSIIKKHIISILNILCILACTAAIISDIQYHIGYNCIPLYCIKALGRCLGIHHAQISTFWNNNNFGVLITVIGIMATMIGGIASRSENKTYGIQRMNLYSSQKIKETRFQVIFCFSSPLFMIFAILKDWCISGLAILFCSYLFSALLFYQFLFSFNDKTDRISIAKILLDSIDLSNNERLLKKYLESIQKSAETEGSWMQIELLFQTIQTEALSRTNEESFLLCFYFFDIIYMKNKNSQHLGIDLLKKGILNYSRRQEKELQNLENIIIWALICSVFYRLDEQPFTEYIRWITNLPKRSTNHIYGDSFISLDDYRFIVMLHLIQMEYRLEKRNEAFDNISYSRLWDHGNPLLREDTDTQPFQQCIALLTDEFDRHCLEKSITNLRDDALSQYGHSIAYTLYDFETSV